MIGRWTVQPASKDRVDAFVTAKHYSHKPSIYWAGFQLVIGGRVEGVCVYGQPSPPIQLHAFRERDFKLYELTRLVVQTTEKNAASYLIGNSLQMLPAPCAVVSFADTEYGHAGIVYQATNWIYTGMTVSHDALYLIDGKKLHPMTLRDMGISNPKAWAAQSGAKILKPKGKHRYFFLVGNRRQKKRMLAALRYPVVPGYPKAEKTMYDAGPRIEVSIAGPLFT